MSFTKKVVAGQTIAAADFAKFFGDHFSEFVKTGFEVTEGTGLVVDISAGTAYVKDASGYMYQIVSSGTETTTLADDSTNYVFLHSDNGATYITNSTSSTVPTDAILLATVVTASGDVTTVTDERNTNPKPVSPKTFYNYGLFRAVSGTETDYIYLNPFLEDIVTIRKVRLLFFAPTSESYVKVYYSLDGSNETLASTTTGDNTWQTVSITINETSSSSAANVFLKFVTYGHPNRTAYTHDVVISYETTS